MVVATEEDLRNLIAARKVHDCFRSIVAFQDSRFDVEISREVQVLFHRVPVLCWQATFVPERHYRNCKAIGTEIVSHSSPAPNQHGR